MIIIYFTQNKFLYNCYHNELSKCDVIYNDFVLSSASVAVVQIPTRAVSLKCIMVAALDEVLDLDYGARYGVWNYF